MQSDKRFGRGGRLRSLITVVTYRKTGEYLGSLGVVLRLNIMRGKPDVTEVSESLNDPQDYVFQAAYRARLRHDLQS